MRCPGDTSPKFKRTIPVRTEKREWYRLLYEFSIPTFVLLEFLIRYTQIFNNVCYICIVKKKMQNCRPTCTHEIVTLGKFCQ